MKITKKQLKSEMKSLNDNPFTMKYFILAILATLTSITSTYAQDIEKEWQLEAGQTKLDSTSLDLSDKDVLTIKDGSFNHNNLSGDYLFQNNVLVFYYDTPTDVSQRLKVQTLTDSTLVFKQKENIYSFKIKEKTAAQLAVSEANKIIPSGGFSVTSLWRGALGMVALLFISFLFSSNRKAIDWKIVVIGLAFQLLIAIGVLKVDFIKTAFEFIGGLFISVLDFNRDGSKFLF